MTKSTMARISLLAAAAVTLGGCQGVQWANMVTLGVTMCLFFGTLNLDRRPAKPSATVQPSVTPSASPPDARAAE